MDRLTLTKKIPPKGQFASNSKKELSDIIRDIDERDIYERLQEYENTGLSPAEISAIKADNDRLHKLIDELECVLPKTRKSTV